jgi:hypothetical protein
MLNLDLLQQDVPLPSLAKHASFASGPVKHRAEFDIAFDVETEIMGYISAKLFMKSPQSDGVHDFLAPWKVDKGHEPVGITYYA